MKNSFFKAYRYLYKVSWFKFILIMLAALAAVNLLCTIPTFFLEVKRSNPNSYGWIYPIFACFISPLIETACIQYLLYKIFAFFIAKKKRLFPAYVLGSSIIFGLFHLLEADANIGWYIFRFCTGMAGGLAFSTTMYFMTRRKQHPFWSTAAVHAITNTLLICSSLIEILLQG